MRNRQLGRAPNKKVGFLFVSDNRANKGRIENILEAQGFDCIGVQDKVTFMETTAYETLLNTGGASLVKNRMITFMINSQFGGAEYPFRARGNQRFHGRIFDFIARDLGLWAMTYTG